MKYRYVAAATLVGVGLGFFCAGRLRAAGIPDAGALTYTGYLENPDGSAVTGSKNIGLQVFDDQAGTNKVCEVPSDAVNLIAGRFQLALPDTCTNAAKAGPDLWVKVEVNGASLGVTKLGAVPYAVEAAHADSASAAAGALDDRITALEDALPNKSAFRAFQAVAQSIESGVDTTLTFDSETFDTGNEFDPTTGVFTAIKPGYYFFSCSTTWVSNGFVGNTYKLAMVYLNGTRVLQDSGNSDDYYPTRATAGVLKLEAGDVVDCRVRQTTGMPQSLNSGVSAGEASASFGGIRLSP